MTPVQGPDREEKLNQMVLMYEHDLRRVCAVILGDASLAQDAVPSQRAELGFFGLQGQQTDTWTAEADITISAIDVNGTIRMTTCPDGWKAYFTFDEAAAKDTDVITDWLLYEDGVPTEEWNLNGGVGGDPLTYYICYHISGEAKELKLVPVYRHAGEKLEEAIVLPLPK